MLRTDRNPDDPGSPLRVVILESWKVIASYLDVSVRTAQLWEKEQGLPIHRRGGEKPRVWAAPDELDAWRLELGPFSRKKARFTLWILLGTFLAAGIAVLAIILLDTGSVHRVEVVDRKVRAFDNEGALLWENAYADFNQAGYDLRLAQPDQWLGEFSQLHDLDGDKEPEVLFCNVAEESLSRTSQIQALDASGKVIWRHEIEDEFQFEERVFRGFVPSLLGVHQGLLVVQASHSRFFPSTLFLLEPSTGTRIDQYWHPGFFRDHEYLDIDGDGQDELLLTANNNPGQGWGHSALMALEIPFPAGEVNPTLGPFNGGRSVETRYLMFPVLDLQRARSQGATAWMTKTLQGELLVENRTADCTAFYYFNSRLELQRASLSDSCFATHRELFHRGILDHELDDREQSAWSRVLEFDTAPNGNSPEIGRLFREAPGCSTGATKPCLQRVEFRQ